MVFVDGSKFEDPLLIDKLDQRDNEERDELVEQLVSIPLREDNPTKTVQIGSLLPKSKRNQLLDLLRRSTDVFAWSVADMLGIPSEVITH